MNNKILLIASLIILLFSCRPKNDVKENEIYSILNEIIADDSLKINRICWELNQFEFKEEYKKDFSAEDLDFIERQIDLNKDFKIKDKKLKWFFKRTHSIIFTEVEKLCDKGMLYHFSFPIISKNRKKVLLEINENCNCLLGGSGRKILYEKQNGHWKKIKVFDYWIS